MSSKDSRFELNVMWGYFDSYGVWRPNPHLEMSADEQYEENKRNGHSMNLTIRRPEPASLLSYI